MPPQQIIQLKPDGSVAQQVLQQVKPNNEQAHAPMQQIIQGPNGILQVLQPLQTVDGQETLFVPNQGMQQAFITPSGQIFRTPLMSAPGNFALQNMPHTVQLPNGKLVNNYVILLKYAFGGALLHLCFITKNHFNS